MPMATTLLFHIRLTEAFVLYISDPTNIAVHAKDGWLDQLQLGMAEESCCQWCRVPKSRIVSTWWALHSTQQECGDTC